MASEKMTAIPKIDFTYSIKPKIAVLMTVFNGVRWMEEQLQSILDQNQVRVTIFISVDKSTDGSEAWVDHRASLDSRIHVLPHGQHFGGAASNFFRLFREVDFSPFDYIGLADQDDIWFAEKLLRASQRLIGAGADAYSSDVIAFWENGKRAYIKKSQRQVKWDFLFEAAGPGCTYVFSNQLSLAIQEVLKNNQIVAQQVGLHDWFIYAFARANGYVWLIDDVAGMLYRQHEHNQVGTNAGIKAFFHRAGKVLGGWALSQTVLITGLVGLRADPFVRRWRDGSRLGLLYLAAFTRQCRRRMRDRFFFLMLCLMLALIGVKVTN